MNTCVPPIGTTPCGTTTPTPGSTGSSSAITFPNPITATTLDGLLGQLLVNLQGIVVLIAIIMIIVGGLMYMFAGVDEKMVETAKKTIGGAVIGLVIILAAPSFLKEILSILGGTTTNQAVQAAPSLKTIAERILNLLLSIVGIIAIIGLIIGGGFYLTSYGDEDRINKGKSILTSSIIGIIVALSALVIVRQIAALIG